MLNKKTNKNLYANRLNNENINNLKIDLFRKIHILEKTIKSKNTSIIYEPENKIFDQIIKNKIIENQKYFCQSNELFSDPEIESNIKNIKVNFNNIEFNMFVYKKNDIVSKTISELGVWEEDSTNKLLSCLNYYSEKKKLPKNDVTIVDIGANIGWYSFFLGKAGYDIISFEASFVNNYILKKNFCLNKDVNITLINKGIGLEEKKCLLHHPADNVGNAIILCGDNADIIPRNYYISEEIIFTKLKNYIPFLSQKNIALLKMDIEGSEGKAIESGIELISEYHIPFLFIEFNPDYLKMQGTDPKHFLETFERNGYKISTIDFFNNRYSSIEEIMKLSATNLYIIYQGFVE